MECTKEAPPVIEPPNNGGGACDASFSWILFSCTPTPRQQQQQHQNLLYPQILSQTIWIHDSLGSLIGYPISEHRSE